MSQELLKRLVLDSDNHSSKYKQKAHDPTDKKAKMGLIKNSKKLKKKEKSTKEINQKSSKILGEKFKSIIKKMKVSTDKNLILEKNLKHLSKIQERAKVAQSVLSHLIEKLPQKS